MRPIVAVALLVVLAGAELGALSIPAPPKGIDNVAKWTEVGGVRWRVRTREDGSIRFISWWSHGEIDTCYFPPDSLRAAGYRVECRWRETGENSVGESVLATGVGAAIGLTAGLVGAGWLAVVGGTGLFAWRAVTKPS